jgi:hypothetical protein
MERRFNMSERILNVVIDVRNEFENDFDNDEQTAKELYLKEVSEKEKIPFDFLKKSVMTKYKLDKFWRDLILLDCPANGYIIKMFESFGYFLSMCPASTKYHSSYYGGWLDHTIDVYLHSMHVLRSFYPNEDDYYPLKDPVFKCALLHDIGKLGFMDQRMYLPNPDESKIEKEPFIYNKKLVQLPHEMYSILLCNKFGIDLTPEEFQAIAYHNLYYLDGAKEALKYKECPLTLIIHTADNLTAKILEA